MGSENTLLEGLAAMTEDQQLILAQILSSALQIVEQLPAEEIERRLALLSSIALVEDAETTVKGH